MRHIIVWVQAMKFKPGESIKAVDELITILVPFTPDMRRINPIQSKVESHLEEALEQQGYHNIMVHAAWVPESNYHKANDEYSNSLKYRITFDERLLELTKNEVEELRSNYYAQTKG